MIVFVAIICLNLLTCVMFVILANKSGVLGLGWVALIIVLLAQLTVLLIDAVKGRWNVGFRHLFAIICANIMSLVIFLLLPLAKICSCF